MKPIEYLAVAILLLSAVLRAFDGDHEASALYAMLLVAYLEHGRVWRDRARVRDQLEIARDEVRAQRVDLSQARSKIRALEQSDDHEAAIDGYPIPPPLPPPPAPGER